MSSFTISIAIFLEGEMVKLYNLVELFGGLGLIMVAIGRGALDGDLWGLVFLVLGIPLFIAGIAAAFGKESWRKKLGAGKTSVAATIIIILLIAAAAYFFLKGGTDFLSTLKPEPEYTIQPVPEVIKLKLPLKIAVYNKLSGQPMTDVSVSVLDSSGRTIETLTLSGSIYVGNLKYMSGERYYVKIVDGSAYIIVPITIPSYEKDIAEITKPDYHEIDVKVPDLPSSLTIKVFDNLGNSVSTVNFTELGTNTVTLSIYVINSEQDTEVYSTFTDPAKGRSMHSVLIASVDSDKVSITGLTPLYASGTTKMFYGDISGLAAVYDPRTSAVNPGTKVFSVTIDGSALSGSATLSISAYVDVDIDYVRTNGVINSEAVALASATITLTK